MELDTVNSPFSDADAVLSADGSTLFFQSSRPGVLTGGPFGHLGIWQAQSILLGDMDCDGDVDFDDIDDFVLALNNPTEYESTYGVPPELKGDIDGDGNNDFDDIDDFVAIFNTPPAQAVPEPSTLALLAIGSILFWGRRWHPGC